MTDRPPAPSSGTAPRFSVLMPAYNAEATIGEAIGSVLGQTYPDWELVVTNDGSTDRTLEIAEGYAARDGRIKVVSQRNAGCAMARRTCIENAKGHYLARLDADDAFDPTFLATVSRFIDRYPGHDLFSANGWLLYPNGRRVGFYDGPRYQTESSFTLDDMLSGYVFGTNTVCSRRVIELTGGPRPGIRSEDIDLWFRAVAHGAKHIHIPKPIYTYRQGFEGQMTGQVPAVWRSHIEIRRDLLESGLLTPRQERLARKQISLLQWRIRVRWDKVLWLYIPAKRFLRRLSSGSVGS